MEGEIEEMNLRRKRKLISVIASVIICLLWTSNVYALESTNSEQSNEQQILFEKTVVLKENEKSENNLVIPKQKDILKESLKRHNLEQQLSNNKISKINGTNQKAAVDVDSLTIKYTVSANNNDRTVSCETKIVAINGVAPESVIVIQFLTSQDGENEGWGQKIYDSSGSSGDWSGMQIHVGQSMTQTVPAETKWWGAFGGVTCMYVHSQSTSEVTWTVPVTLVNRTGNKFPDYIDTWSGKKASDGLRTDWRKTSTSVKYTNIERGNAIASYISKYGDPKYEWKREKKPNYYEMHHIQPRALGGTNDLSNFIPIPYLNHQAISSWFMGYLDPNASIDPSDE